MNFIRLTRAIDKGIIKVYSVAFTYHLKAKVVFLLRKLYRVSTVVPIVRTSIVYKPFSYSGTGPDVGPGTCHPKSGETITTALHFIYQTIDTTTPKVRISVYYLHSLTHSSEPFSYSEYSSDTSTDGSLSPGQIT